MENPYASPQTEETSDDSHAAPSRWVRHVGRVAVLMMLQGALELVLGALMTMIGVILAAASGGAIPPGGGGPPVGMPWALSAFYLVLGIAALGTGGLRIFAGYRNIKYRGRVLGIVSLSCGFLTMMTGLCALTGIPLFIYGLIVYLNSDVVRAFEMGEQGASSSEIRAALSA